MPPKRKNKSEGKEETKKTKTSSATSSSGTQQGIGDWKKKSSEEFKIIPEGNKPSDDEWKIYYQKRKKAEEFHKKVLENDENLGMEQLIMEAIEKVVQANTKLTEGDKSKVLNQFLITQLEACFEDSDLDDLRSCTIVVTAYSDHSYSSIEFEFEYHFRVRGYGIEFFRSFKYATYDKPSTTPKKTVWYSNGAPSEYEEDRKFKLTLGQLLNMKELLFREIICERLSNYEFVKLTLESIAQFGETGNVKDDDWIGYHNRMLCGCPTKEDRDFVHPTSRISRLGVEQDYDKAMEWHLKSGSLAKSQYNIGVLFQNGQGVEKDYVKAFEWYLKAAENGDADAQYNIALLYEDGKGVGKDYSKAFEWYLKSAENGDTYAQFNIGLFYRDGIGVGKDYVKAFEWYLKSAKNGNKLGQFNVGCCYENGVSAEKDVKAALYWKAKGLNEIDFKFIGPYPEFGIEVFRNCANNDMKQITSETEQVIIRFEEKDFNVSHTLSSSKYLSTLMNSNWRNFNEKHDGRIILDLRSIQNEIFQEEGHHIQIFEIYLNYLTSDILPTDCELKLKLIELSRYLGDDECILQVMKESSILMRLYILFKFEMIEPIHIAIASCYVTESSESATLNIDDLSENILEVLLTQIQLSSLAKKEILNAFVKKFTNLSSSIVFNNNVLHLKYNFDEKQKEFKFNDTEIILKLEEGCNEDGSKTTKLNSSQNVKIFGVNAKFYVQLNHENNIVWAFNFNMLKNSGMKREEKEKLSNFGLALFVGVCILVVSIVIGSTTSRCYRNEAHIPPNSILSRINDTFYHRQYIVKDRRSNSIYISNEILHLYSNTIARMHNCKTSMEGYYGESGIGKTAMLHKALEVLNPRPYLLITLTNATTENSIAKRLNIQFNDNEPISWNVIEDAILQFLDNLPSSEKYCPIIIIDNANRNHVLTNYFINIVREELRSMSLLIVSSDQTFEEFGDSAGGRLSYIELLDPSYEFGVQYLSMLNITNQTEINKIIELVGTKPLYLEYVERLIRSDGSVDFERLERRIYSLVVMSLARLPTEVQKEIDILARALLERPSTPHYVNDSLPEEYKRMIFSSNILRKEKCSYDQRVAFQNKIVMKYFQRKVLKGC